MMSTNLFVIANVKQLRTCGNFRILLSFFRTSWGVGFPNSAIFKSFHNRAESGTIFEGLLNFGGGLNPPPPRLATNKFTKLDCESVEWIVNYKLVDQYAWGRF